MTTFVDASVIVAILGREPGWEEILKGIEKQEEGFYLSPLVRFEAVLALARMKTLGKTMKPSADTIARARHAIDAFTAALGAKEIPISSEIGSIALDATMTYGKAIGHPADLNFGDCFAYACAKSLNATLAYKGGDFALTDLA